MNAEQTDPIILATYEALANVATHAYLDGTGTLDLRARYLPDRHQVEVTISDRGRWQTSSESSGRGGRGIPLIRMLTEHTDIEPSPNGTTVRMYWTLAPSETENDE